MLSFLWWLAQNTVVTAVLIGLVAVASSLLRTRPALLHALWVVVLLKFLTPPIIAWPWTVEQTLAAMWTSEGTVQEVQETQVAVESPAITGVGEDIRWVPQSTSDAEVAHAEAREDNPQLVQLAARLAPTRTWAVWLAFLWLAGTGVVLLVQARRLIRFHRLVGQARPAPLRLTAEIEQVARQLGMRPLAARITARVVTPCVWCFGRLRLIWPEGLTGATDVERCRGVIAHELAHVKRRDHLIAWMELIAGCLWWWNPLFWYLRRQLRETADLACDAHVVSTGLDRRTYAETFLDLSRLVSQRQTPAPALGVSTGAHRTIERRLSMILNERVKARTSAVSLVLVTAVALAAFPAWSLGQIGEVDSAAGPAKRQLSQEPDHADELIRLRAERDQLAREEKKLEAKLAIEQATAQLAIGDVQRSRDLLDESQKSSGGTAGADFDNDGQIDFVMDPSSAQDAAGVEQALEKLRGDVAEREAELARTREKIQALESVLQGVLRQPRKFAPAAAMKGLRFDFRDQRLDRRGWTISGPESSVHSEQEGLRIRLPAERTTVTLKSLFLMEGDFEVTAHVQILRLGEVDAGDGLGVYLSVPSPVKESVPYLARKVDGDGRQQFLAGFTKAGTKDWTSLFTKGELATMRLTRVGNVVRYYAGTWTGDSSQYPAQGEDLRLMREVTLDRIGARAVNLAVSNTMSPVEADVRLLDLTVRAEAIIDISRKEGDAGDLGAGSSNRGSDRGR